MPTCRYAWIFKQRIVHTSAHTHTPHIHLTHFSVLLWSFQDIRGWTGPRASTFPHILPIGPRLTRQDVSTEQDLDPEARWGFDAGWSALSQKWQAWGGQLFAVVFWWWRVQTFPGIITTRTICRHPKAACYINTGLTIRASLDITNDYTCHRHVLQLGKFEG